MEGDVKAVRADELGADMNGSWINRSWGDTVPRLEVELEALLKSKTVGTAGEEKAVLAPPSKAVNSSSSTSAAFIILAVCWTLPVL